MHSKILFSRKILLAQCPHISLSLCSLPIKNQQMYPLHNLKIQNKPFSIAISWQTNKEPVLTQANRMTNIIISYFIPLAKWRGAFKNRLNSPSLPPIQFFVHQYQNCRRENVTCTRWSPDGTKFAGRRSCENRMQISTVIESRIYVYDIKAAVTYPLAIKTRTRCEPEKLPPEKSPKTKRNKWKNKIKVKENKWETRNE